MTRTLALVGVAAAAAAAVAQPEFRGETTVNVIEVPVRVVDPRTGAPVTGLTRADFVVRENGEPHEITNFAEVNRFGGPSPAAPTGADDGVAEPAVPQPLEIVYFFDLYLMLAGDRDRAVEALWTEFEGGVPDDLSVSIVSFDGALRSHLDRSKDGREILNAIAEVSRLTTYGLNQMVAFTSALSPQTAGNERDPAYYERRQRSREFFTELERRTSRVGAALSSAMARYADGESRRVVVAFTPGHPATRWAPSYAPIDFLNAAARYPTEELWRQVALEASDLGFTLFIVDTSGLRGGDRTTADQGVTSSLSSVFDSSGEFIGEPGQANLEGSEQPSSPELTGVDPEAGMEEMGQWLERTRKSLLISSSRLTGGAAKFSKEPEQAIAAIDDSLSHYYSIAYSPPHAGDGKEYRIEIGVRNRPELRVIHRTAYVDQLATLREAERLRSRMLFAADANPLGVRVVFGEVKNRFRLGAAGSKRVRVPVQVQIPYAGLEMIPRGDMRWGKVMVTFFSEDATGNQSPVSTYEQPITIASSRYREAVARGYFAYKITVQLEGGTQRLFVGVQDLLGGSTSVVPETFEF